MPTKLTATQNAERIQLANSAASAARSLAASYR